MPLLKLPLSDHDDIARLHSHEVMLVVKTVSPNLLSLCPNAWP
jgi:hypothetical protein